MINEYELKEFLEEKYDQYNRNSFIETDPICIPHSLSRKEDIEISAFLTATIAWGQRTTIIKNAKNLIGRMDHSPFEFIMNAGNEDMKHLKSFKHRTFNGDDLIFFLGSIKAIYTKFGGFEKIFSDNSTSVKSGLIALKKAFFQHPHLPRSTKHISDPGKGSAAKRLNMFLRWMIRNDRRGVDFGIWKGISKAELMIPLDVHSGNVARKLGLLKRKQNDWKAVEELTSTLKKFDPRDPVKYDFALFGLGAFEKF